MVGKDSPWILERAMTTSKMENQSVSNMIKNDILPKTVKRNSQ